VCTLGEALENLVKTGVKAMGDGLGAMGAQAIAAQAFDGCLDDLERAGF
jgi:hypothetical protein